MSIVSKENIEVIAECVGINNLSPDVALAVAPDVEYRLREIMQVILLFMLKLRYMFGTSRVFFRLYLFRGCLTMILIS